MQSLVIFCPEGTQILTYFFAIDLSRNKSWKCEPLHRYFISIRAELANPCLGYRNQAVTQKGRVDKELMREDLEYYVGYYRYAGDRTEPCDR